MTDESFSSEVNMDMDSIVDSSDSSIDDVAL